MEEWLEECRLGRNDQNAWRLSNENGRFQICVKGANPLAHIDLPQLKTLNNISSFTRCSST